MGTLTKQGIALRADAQTSKPLTFQAISTDIWTNSHVNGSVDTSLTKF